MKHLLIIVLLLTSLNAQDFIQKDKVKHGAAGAGIYYGCLGVGEFYDIDWLSRSMCWTINLGIAGLKELYDRKHGGVCDANDITAQALAPSIDVVVWSWGGETRK